MKKNKLLARSLVDRSIKILPLKGWHMDTADNLYENTQETFSMRNILFRKVILPMYALFAIGAIIALFPIAGIATFLAVILALVVFFKVQYELDEINKKYPEDELEKRFQRNILKKYQIAQIINKPNPSIVSRQIITFDYMGRTETLEVSQNPVTFEPILHPDVIPVCNILE